MLFDLWLFERDRRNKEKENERAFEICCGSGHSLKYLADKGAGELWGRDLSQKQLDNAGKLS